jgi:hypothetical protein
LEVNLDTASESADSEINKPPKLRAKSLMINRTTNSSEPHQELQDRRKADAPIHSTADDDAGSKRSFNLSIKEEQEQQAREETAPMHGTATVGSTSHNTVAFLHPLSNHNYFKDIGLMDPFFSLQFLEDTAFLGFQAASATQDTDNAATDTAHSRVRLGRTLKAATVESNSQELTRTIQHSTVPPKLTRTLSALSMNVHEVNDSDQSGSSASVRPTEAGRQAPGSKISAQGSNKSVTVSNRSRTAMVDSENETSLYHWRGTQQADSSQQVINYRLHLIHLLPETTDREKSEFPVDEARVDWTFPLATLLLVIVVTLPFVLFYLFTTRSRWMRR